MGVEEHHAHAPRSVGFAVVTVSDSRTEETDETGSLLRRSLAEAGHREVLYLLAKDDVAAIQAAVEKAVQAEAVDAIVMNGGTGVSPRDVTWEAVTPLLDRTLPGFGELFRILSHREIGSAAMLSRAFAGVLRDTLLFALPGAPAGSRLALEALILPELGHLVGELRMAHAHE